VREALVPLLTATLFHAGHLLARASRVLNHLAAGTLTVRQLRVGIERTWEEFSARDADVAAGLTGWEATMIARFVSREDDVLLVGSGPGRDLIALVAGGYRVTAVEPARRAITTSRRQLEMRGLSAAIIEGFFEEVALPRRFDVIIFSDCCYNFIPESRRRIAALRKAGDHLTARGHILISYMTEQGGHPLLIRLARLAARITGSDWQPEPGDIVLPVDPARPLFHYEHPFKPGELEAEAEAAGLRTVHRCNAPGTPFVVLESMSPGNPGAFPPATATLPSAAAAR
jgi:SAM-dependent methyltransferase